jgi:hypothetical protein
MILDMSKKYDAKKDGSWEQQVTQQFHDELHNF